MPSSQQEERDRQQERHGLALPVERLPAVKVRAPAADFEQLRRR
jgi:hypothetical protein